MLVCKNLFEFKFLNLKCSSLVFQCRNRCIVRTLNSAYSACRNSMVFVNAFKGIINFNPSSHGVIWNFNACVFKGLIPYIFHYFRRNCHSCHQVGVTCNVQCGIQ